MFWVHNQEGKFTSATTYLFLKEKRPIENKSLFRRLWKAIIPPKIKSFAWQLMHDRVPTKENLLKCNIITEARFCELCGTKPESFDHILLKCNEASNLWSLCYQWRGIQQPRDHKVKKSLQ